MKKFFVWMIAAAAVAGIAAIAATLALTAERDFLETFGFSDADVKTMVAALEANTEDRALLGASIDGENLTLKADGKTRTYKLPAGEFYLSVAPYIATTHECTTHNLVTCRGELAGEQFQVMIRATDGSIAFDGTVTAGANGFFGIWLPAGIQGTIFVSRDGLSAAGAITTVPASPTCMTTLLLS